MKTIVFPKSTHTNVTFPVIVDSNSADVTALETDRSLIRSVYIAPEDCEVRYYVGSCIKTLKACKGDIVIEFYEKSKIKNPVIVVKNKEWRENIAYMMAEKNADQARTETIGVFKYNEMRNCGDSDCQIAQI